MWKHYFILVYLVFFIHNLSFISSFNVETEHYSVFVGDKASMFGYSTAEYRDQNHRGWVIVGAPQYHSNKNGIGGAVFKCNIVNEKCYLLTFDNSTSNNLVRSRNYGSVKQIEPIDNKTSQWFGATLSTSMIDGGPIVACAPKYHWFGYSKQSFAVAGLKDAIGTCWLKNDESSRESIEFSPCRNNDTAGHHRQGMCQAGIGVSITKDGKRLFIGAPGSWYWQGQLFTIESNVKSPFLLVKNGSSSGFLATQEGPAHEDNSYLGYSVAVGDFLGDGDSGAAVGVPRGLDLDGKVLLFTSQLRNHQNISGFQMGAYFGYAMAVSDIDGDSRDDLVITAPFYTQPESAGVKIETGRIYVYYQGNGYQKFVKYDTRDGESNRGQFGLSVASLGDIDRDGFGDFVVGEPYGGPENRGAVYIYHGSEQGVEEKYSQVILSENLEQPLRTFGWSVSGGLDLDNNLYNDLVVGAYESTSAVYFRSRPVIKIVSTIYYESKLIDLRNQACLLADGTPVTCSGLKVCCTYSGDGTWSQHSFTIHVTLDDKKKKNPRLFFLDFENKNVFNWTVLIKKSQLYCRLFKVYIAQHLRDKLTSLDAEMQVELEKDQHSSILRKIRDPQKQLTPVLGPKNIKNRDSLSIQKNCGSDNICVPDLVMYVKKNVEKYLLGSGKRLELEVNIQNRAEDAFETVFYLQLPAGIDYVNVERESPRDSSNLIIQCSAPKSSNNNTLRCDVGNPLPEGKIVKFKIILQPTTFDGMKPVYELNMKVNSTNPEKPESLRNNVVNISIPLWIETDIAIEGQSKPQVLDLNSVDYANIDFNSIKNKLEYAPSVVHNYTIRNAGPSTVLNITTSLIWTAVTASNDILLYLLEQPEISKEKVYCDSANADYLSIKDKIIQKRTENQNVRSKRQTSNHLTGRKRDNRNLMFNPEILCKTKDCVYLQCHVGPLLKDEEITIAVRYLVNVSSIEKIIPDDKLKIHTKLVARVTSQPFIGEPAERVIRSYETETVILPATPVPTSDEIPLWILILSAIAGITILFLLIFLLYKCGFFKRNRPSAGPEREPLNRS